MVSERKVSLFNLTKIGYKVKKKCSYELGLAILFTRSSLRSHDWIQTLCTLETAVVTNRDGEIGTVSERRERERERERESKSVKETRAVRERVT